MNAVPITMDEIMLFEKQVKEEAQMDDIEEIVNSYDEEFEDAVNAFHVVNDLERELTSSWKSGLRSREGYSTPIEWHKKQAHLVIP